MKRMKVTITIEGGETPIRRVTFHSVGEIEMEAEWDPPDAFGEPRVRSKMMEPPRSYAVRMLHLAALPDGTYAEYTYKED